MLRFSFRARSQEGTLVLDVIDADDELQAKKKISELGLIPIELRLSTLKPVSGSAAFRGVNLKKVLSFGSKISLDEFLAFNRQIQIVYKVGMPIVKGLNLVALQTPNVVLRAAVQKIADEVANGRPLFESFALFPKIFDESFVSLIRVGESSGKLDFILNRIAEFTEEKLENSAKIKSATLYPKIVAAVFVIVVLVVVYFVVPKIKIFYDQFKVDLPWPTQMLVLISNFALHYWYVILAGGIAVPFIYRKAYESKNGRWLLDGLMLKIPLFGDLLKQVETRTFCATLELLVSGGVPILESLKLVKSSLSNVRFRTEVDKCIVSVDNGGTMAKVIEEGQLFPSLVPGLLNVGESTGEIEKVLAQISDYYQLQIKHRLDNLTKLIEPFLIVFIFAGVLGLALAVYLPIWRMNAVVKR